MFLLDAVLEEEIAAETGRVMRERAFTDRRLGPVIAQAMRLAVREHERPPREVADRMIRNHAEYTGSGRLLRFTWGPRKFFGEGHWCNSPGWPFDQGLLAASRRL